MKLKHIDNIIGYDKLNLQDDIFPNAIKKFNKEFGHIEFIKIYYNSDGLKIEGYIVRNKKVKNKLPVIIFCRGGNNHPEKKLGQLNVGTLIKPEFVKLIDEGKIILFASNYRGSDNSEGVDEFGGRDVYDVINLYPIIEKYKYSDKNNIALYGWSRGCIMTFIVLRKVNWVKCVIVGAPPTNLLNQKIERPKMYDMLKNNFNLTKKDLMKRSVIFWTNMLPKTVPILILHGSADCRVDVNHSFLLSKKLQEYKIPYQLIIFPGGDHGLSEYQKKVSDEIIDWIENYLINNKQITINLEQHGK